MTSVRAEKNDIEANKGAQQKKCTTFVPAQEDNVQTE